MMFLKVNLTESMLEKGRKNMSENMLENENMLEKERKNVKERRNAKERRSVKENMLEKRRRNMIVKGRKKNNIGRKKESGRESG